MKVTRKLLDEVKDFKNINPDKKLAIVFDMRSVGNK